MPPKRTASRPRAPGPSAHQASRSTKQTAAQQPRIGQQFWIVMALQHAPPRRDSVAATASDQGQRHWPRSQWHGLRARSAGREYRSRPNHPAPPGLSAGFCPPASAAQHAAIARPGIRPKKPGPGSAAPDLRNSERVSPASAMAGSDWGHQSWFQFESWRCHWRCTGAADRPALVLLHGLVPQRPLAR